MSQTATHQRRFEVLREIASGGFGTVYLCRVTGGDGFASVVAIKLLHPQWSENEEVSSRMRDEARLLGLLRHKNIVVVHDLTRLDDRIAVVMEYLEAVDLKSIVQGGAILPVSAALQLGAQVASALDAAFNKAPVGQKKPLRVVHRDIKPSNIMVDAEGTAKVLDFGVARGDFDSREAETLGMAFGSFDYMPPERRFMESGGETSDVYSLGAVLYEVLSHGEKLGKGKLKKEAHRAVIDERISTLKERLSSSTGRPDGVGVNPRSVDELTGFLTQMLAFDAEDRPPPGQVTSALRRMSRAFSDGALDEWAEIHVPPLLVRMRSSTDRKRSDPLVGKKLIEARTGGAVELEATAEPAESSARSADPPRTADPPRPPPRAPSIDYQDIPKRVRDAAPSRPAITGTQTPAPLRRARRASPANPMVDRMATPSPPARSESTKPSRSWSTALYVTVWVFGLFVLLAGAVAMLAVSWLAGQG